jgi:hypothetical protein
MRDRVLVVLGALLAIAPLTVPERVWAQDAATSAAAEADTDQGAPDADLLTADELDVLMAPVALYPDTLLAQILYATTYPLDVVKAGRFVEQNVGMPDKDRADAVKTMDWDPSVHADERQYRLDRAGRGCRPRPDRRRYGQRPAPA